jgi:O-succinylbenzoic acid--CoA ligase
MEEALSGIADPRGLVFLPPHLEHLRAAVEAEAGAPGRVLFATSGSSGRPKLVAHSAASLRASAEAVNVHLGCGPQDVWLRALPLYHVGGFGMHVRAELAGGRVAVLDAPWSPEALTAGITAAGATVLSLVPTQVYDIAQSRLRCPATLRAAVVGGGRLDPALADRARDLGWPLLASYGSTEAGSQVATEREPGSGMVVLGGWEVRVSDRGELEIRGAALFEGYWEPDHETGRYRFRDPESADGWFATGDAAELNRRADGTRLAHLCRLGRTVKLLGELVDLDALEAAAGPGVAIIALADARAGSRLVAVAEHGSGFDPERFNASRPGFERVDPVIWVGSLPRTASGKVGHAEAASLFH